MIPLPNVSVSPSSTATSGLDGVYDFDAPASSGNSSGHRGGFYNNFAAPGAKISTSADVNGPVGKSVLDWVTIALAGVALTAFGWFILKR